MAGKKKVEPVPMERGRRERLVELRDMLDAAMRSAEPSVMAQLAGQYRLTLKELDELPSVLAVSATQQLVAKRRAERAGLKAV